MDDRKFGVYDVTPHEVIQLVSVSPLVERLRVLEPVVSDRQTGLGRAEIHVQYPESYISVRI